MNQIISFFNFIIQRTLPFVTGQIMSIRNIIIIITIRFIVLILFDILRDIFVFPSITFHVTVVMHNLLNNLMSSYCVPIIMYSLFIPFDFSLDFK